MYPEWIQEQLDKIATSRQTTRRQRQSSSSQNELTPQAEQRLALRIATMESRIIHQLNYRLDRIEAKLDYFLRMCEDAGAE